MPSTHPAKLFLNGASQAVRLPAEFRFPGKEVYVRRDPATGDVILSQHPGPEAWTDFFRLVHRQDGAEDAMAQSYMAERPMNRPPERSGPFDDEEAA